MKELSDEKPKKYYIQVIMKRVPLEEGYNMAYATTKITGECVDCASDELIESNLMETFFKVRDYGDAVGGLDE